MVYEVKWTNAARDNYRDIVSFIYDKWGQNSAERFTEELQTALMHLTTFPFMGRQDAKLSYVRQLVISGHQILFYSVVDDFIVVLNVIDSKRM